MRVWQPQAKWRIKAVKAQARKGGEGRAAASVCSETETADAPIVK
jgi:hypothetical protein